MRAGVDIGGTFTDLCIAGPDGIVAIGKALGTPATPAQSVENVLRDVSGRIVLADFGAAREFERDGLFDAVSGTRQYLAPEVLAGDNPGPASDQFALGVLLYRLLTRRYPYTADDLDQLRVQQLAEARGPLGLPSLGPSDEQELVVVVAAEFAQQEAADPLRLAAGGDARLGGEHLALLDLLVRDLLELGEHRLADDRAADGVDLAIDQVGAAAIVFGQRHQVAAVECPHHDRRLRKGVEHALQRFVG